jgi:hypothetical protein
MAEDLEARFRVRLEGKEELSGFFKKSGAEAKSFSDNLGKNLKTAGSHISSFASKASSSLASFSGGSFNAGIAANARGVLQFRDALSQLAVSAGKSQDYIKGLKDEIHKVAVSSNQMQDAVTASLQAFVERTGDVEAATRNLALYGKVATATSASMEDVTRVGESMFSKFNLKGDQANAFNIISAQSKVGSIEIRDFATQGASVFAAARAAGLPANEQGVAEIGALMQVVAGGSKGKGKQTAADTAVQVAAMLSAIRMQGAKLEGMGIKVDGRDQVDVVKEIIEKTGGNAGKLAMIFRNKNAFRAVYELSRGYLENKGWGGERGFDTFRAMGGNPGQMDQDFRDRTSTGASKLTRAEIWLKKFNDENLGGLAEFAAEHVTGLSMGASALGYAGKGMGMAGRLINKFGKGAGGVGGALATLGAQRVFVVGGKLDGMGPGVPGMPGSGGSGGMGWLGKAGLVAGAGAAGYALGSFIDSKFGLSDKIAKAMVGDDNSNYQRAFASRESAKKQQIAILESRGMAHGQAVHEADRRLAEIKAVNVYIDKDGKVAADVEGGSGTQSPKVMARRSMGGM